MNATTPWRRLPPDAPAADPTPVPAEAVVALHVPPNKGVPNHPRWPALMYPAALAGEPDIDRIKALFERNRWFRVWHWTVFDCHHFHPSAAEVLVVADGRASIRLGGPDGRTHLVRAGDAMVLPPGFGHCLKAASEDFVVVGAYPEGQERREVVPAGIAAMEAAFPVIARVPRPVTDPLFGPCGPLFDHWAGP